MARQHAQPDRYSQPDIDAAQAEFTAYMSAQVIAMRDNRSTTLISTFITDSAGEHLPGARRWLRPAAVCPHLALGSGARSCLGQALAAELQAVLDRAAAPAALAGARRPAEECSRSEDWSWAGLREVPVRW